MHNLISHFRWKITEGIDHRTYSVTICIGSLVQSSKNSFLKLSEIHKVLPFCCFLFFFSFFGGEGDIEFATFYVLKRNKKSLFLQSGYFQHKIVDFSPN